MHKNVSFFCYGKLDSEISFVVKDYEELTLRSE